MMQVLDGVNDLTAPSRVTCMINIAVPKIQAGRASDGAKILSFFGILSVLVTEMRSQKIFSRK